MCEEVKMIIYAITSKTIQSSEITKIIQTKADSRIVRSITGILCLSVRVTFTSLVKSLSAGKE